MNTQDSNPIVTLVELAKRLGMTPQTARAWIRRGWIVGALRGPSGRWYVPQAEADRLLRGDRGGNA